jgi:hypothetical protein
MLCNMLKNSIYCSVRWLWTGRAYESIPLRYAEIHVGSTGIGDAPSTLCFFDETETGAHRLVVFTFQGTGRSEIERACGEVGIVS